MRNNNNNFICNICDKQFTRQDNLSRHMQSHQPRKNIICQICGQQFSRADNLNRHLQSRHEQANVANGSNYEVVNDQLPSTPNVLDFIEQHQRQQENVDNEMEAQQSSTAATSSKQLSSIIPDTQQ